MSPFKDLKSRIISYTIIILDEINNGILFVFIIFLKVEKLFTNIVENVRQN